MKTLNLFLLSVLLIGLVSASPLQSINLTENDLKLNKDNTIIFQTFDTENNPIELDSIEINFTNANITNKETLVLGNGTYEIDFYLPNQNITQVDFELKVTDGSKMLKENYTLNTTKTLDLSDMETNFNKSIQEISLWFRDNQGMGIMIIFFVIVLVLMLVILSKYS